jgi:hypothetical protein
MRPWKAIEQPARVSYKEVFYKSRVYWCTDKVKSHNGLWGRAETNMTDVERGEGSRFVLFFFFMFSKKELNIN